MSTKAFGNLAVILGLLAHTGLAATAILFPDVWFQNRSTTLFVFLGLNFAFLSAEVALITRKALSEATDLRSDIDAVLDGVKTQQLREEDFYTDFAAAVNKADHTVRISYFAPYPPNHREREQRTAYYQFLQTRLPALQGLSVFRLVRDTRVNRTWVADLAQRYRNHTHLNLAVLADSSSETMGKVLSVQTIDDDRAWLVAVTHHEQQGPYRDLYIRHHTVATWLRAYHKRLWEKAQPVVDHGEITEFGETVLEDGDLSDRGR